MHCDNYPDSERIPWTRVGCIGYTKSLKVTNMGTTFTFRSLIKVSRLWKTNSSWSDDHDWAPEIIQETIAPASVKIFIWR
jgi:hypothetical protein